MPRLVSSISTRGTSKRSLPLPEDPADVLAAG
jgi:hypothetical protein